VSQTVSRKAFYRTDISRKEKSIGSVILLLLVAILAGIAIQGRRYDATKYTGDTSALESTRQAVEGKAATLRSEVNLPGNAVSSSKGAAPVLAAQALPALVDTMVPMGPEEHYTEDTLYEKINGRAPAYFEYNFQELTARSFSVAGKPGAFIDVFLYRMDSPLNAFGIFSAERDPSGAPLDFVDDGYLSGMGFFLRAGPVYAQILASSTDADVLSAAEAYARELVGTLPSDDSGMGGRSFLPMADRVPGSVTYINENAYGQQVLSSVYEARYAVDGTELTAFAQQNPDAQTARTNWETLRDFYSRYGTIDEEFEAGGAAVFIGEVFGEWNVIYAHDSLVSGVINCADKESARSFILNQLGIEETATPEEDYSY
jgi:hypothetical protein